MTCILGIDPGLGGALAFYYIDTRRVSVYDMPVADGAVSAVLLTQLIRNYGPSIALIENVHSMPRDSKKGAFSFGRSFGTALGVLGALEIETQFETPTKWKAYFRLSKDKEEARAKALHLFPACHQHFARKMDHGRAEAALIARYAAETMFPHTVAT